MAQPFASQWQKTIIHNGKFIRFLKYGHWEYVERSNCTGIVIIAALTKDQKVLFVEQFRPPVRKKVVEFPAGLVSDKRHLKNESILKAAKRELWEETGYQAKKMVKLTDGPVSSGLTSDMVTMVLATELTKTGKGGGDSTEGITTHEVKLKEVDRWLLQMKRKGYLVEPKIYAGLYFLNKYNDLLNVHRRKISK